MSVNNWKFTEDQRDDVSNGKLCPSCLNKKIKNCGSIQWATVYKCAYCHESWEGN